MRRDYGMFRKSKTVYLFFNYMYLKFLRREKCFRSYYMSILSHGTET